MNKQRATAEKKQWKTRKGEKNEEELMKKKVPKKTRICQIGMSNSP